MKKIFYSIFAATTMLMAVSCSQDEELVSSSNGNEEVVTFTVNTGVVTRAAGDGNTVNKVHYEVWDKNTGKLVISTIPTSGAMTQARAEGVSGGRASVSMSLVKGVPYDITFWAQNEEGTAYDISAGLDDIKLKGGLKANKEVYDAFFKTVEDFKVKNGSTTVELKRPFAQVNIGTAPADWQRAIALGVKIDKSTVTVSGVHNQFNARTAEATGKASVTFDYNALLNETFEVKDSTYQYLAMNYLLADVEKSLHNLDVTFNVGDQVINNINIANMPIQRNWRTNIVGRLLTSDEDFVIIIDEEFDNDHNLSEIIVNSDEELDAALRQDIDGDLIINLGKNAQTRAVEESSKVYNVNISAWVEEYYFGGAKTNSITINANGNTINFVHNNGDWNYIRCVNEDCKWYINDAHLTNSGKNEGPWNRHNIRFYNAVELNNVTSDKAIALLNDGTLKNVQITENGDVYGLWITAEGQTVDVDGLTIKSAGRGIAIKDEYVDSPEKVTLNVKNAKFNTAKKAAVLVSSVAGADINWGEGNDISGVAADQINAVWVDDAYNNIEDVTVTGALCVMEGTTVNPFTIEGNVVELPAGIYKFPAKVAAGVTIKCAEGTVFSGSSNLNINGATVEGATFSNPEGSAVGSTINGTFKDCTFTGKNGLRYCYAGETVVFEDCVFDGSTYGAHFDGGSNDVIFRRCQFSGFNAFGGALTLLTLEDCVFKSTGKSGYNGANLWGTTNITGTKFIFDGAASTEWIGLNAAQSGKVITLTDCVVEGTDKSVFAFMANYNSGNKVTVDGVEYVLVEDADGLTAALAGDVKDIYLQEGATFEGTFKPVNGAKNLFSEATDKAVIKGRVNISNYADGISFENIKFAINDASKVKNSFTGSQYKYPGIVMIYAAATSFEGCEFECDITSGVCGINYGAHADGKLLSVNNCSFEGDFYAIRTRTLFSITNSNFNVYTDQGKLAAVWTWGNGNSWADAVTFTGNKNLNANEIYGVQLGSTNFAYNDIAINVQGNEGFAKLEESINDKCTFSNITFANGSETF